MAGFNCVLCCVMASKPSHDNSRKPGMVVSVATKKLDSEHEMNLAPSLFVLFQGLLGNKSHILQFNY